MRPSPTSPLLPALLAAVLTCVAIPALMAQEEDTSSEAPTASKAPVLSIEEIMLTPEKPAAETLVQLRVRVGNKGTKTASQLAFRVTVNGQELSVYGNQLFMYPVAPGADNEIRLYNFWTTETSREMPKDGKLTVEVTLTEARWVKIADDEEGVEVWTPEGDVTGLPVSKSVTLAMEK